MAKLSSRQRPCGLQSLEYLLCFWPFTGKVCLGRRGAGENEWIRVRYIRVTWRTCQKEDCGSHPRASDSVARICLADKCPGSTLWEPPPHLDQGRGARSLLQLEGCRLWPQTSGGTWRCVLVTCTAGMGAKEVENWRIQERGQGAGA